MSSVSVGAAAGRWDDIDRAKGLAIFLVVAGHVVAREMPPGAEWFAAVKWGIYSFHMAFFMYLSGFVFFLSRQPERARPDFNAYVLGRLNRFLPAYLLFAGLVWAAKMAAAQVVHVDNASAGLGGLLDVVLRPTVSVASFLWYVWVLMLFQIATPLLLRMARRVWIWTLAAVPLLFIPGPSYFLGLDKICDFLFFFLLGGVCATYAERYLVLLRWAWLPALVAFVAGLLIFEAKQNNIALSLLCIPALHGLCRWGLLSRWGWLAFLGLMSFPIYLMNTMAIGGTKALLFTFTNWNGPNFYWVFPLLLAAGVLLPIAVKQWGFVHFRWLDRATT